MPWEKARYHVETVTGYCRAIGKQDWAEALELCLSEAERCQAMQEVALDLRLRLEAEPRRFAGEPEHRA